MDVNIYEGVGGDETFRKLVDAFYRRIETDARIHHMFPPDLAPGKTWQFLFLTQYFGGPQRYNASRGHPRLRMRHPMPIGQVERDAWVQNMHEAIDEVGIRTLPLVDAPVLRRRRHLSHQPPPTRGGRCALAP